MTHGANRIEAKALIAGYGRADALRGLDAGIPAGELVAVLGENGSGKSTFLKVLARIVPPRGGDVLVDGVPLAELPRRETAKRIAYVPQSADLVFPIRSLDLVLQGRAPRARGFSADSPEDRAFALEAMQACDVASLADRDASALSGGERRRVFLARALAAQAEIWLLDEPTTGLDPRHRLEFFDLLARIHRERSITVLLVSHEIAVAEDLATRVLLVRDGRTLAEGPTAEVLTPENLRRAFDVESRVDLDGAGRRRIVPVAPARPGPDPLC